MRTYLRIIALSTAVISTPAFADHRFETAGTFYKDDTQHTYIESAAGTFDLGLFGEDEPGWGSSLTLGVTAKQTKYDDKEDPVVEQLEGDTELKQISYSVAMTQSLGVGRQLGFNVGLGDSPVGSSKWAGMNYGHWFLEETLQAIISVTRTWVTQDPISRLLPGDIERVFLPENVQGWNFGLSLYQLTTPNLILRGGYNLIARSDRPNAHVVNGEARYFVEKTQTAVHGKASYYLNTGTIKPVTLHGEVKAYSFAAEAHQRLGKQWILMAGYRYYFEKETPKADTASINQIGSDYVYSSLRYRYADMNWTADESPEVYFFGGYYKNNAPNKAFLVGIGTSIYF